MPGAQRDPDADLLGPQRHTVGHDAEDPKTRQRQRQHANSGGDRARDARAQHPSLEVLVHRRRGRDDARVEACGFAQDWRQPIRIGPRPRDQGDEGEIL